MTVGTCSSFTMRYFWNASSFKCETFQYSGCDANGNNFETEEDCLSECDPFHGSVSGSEDDQEECDLTCPDGECKMEAGRCDGQNDCAGNVDELDCPREISCIRSCIPYSLYQAPPQ